MATATSLLRGYLINLMVELFINAAGYIVFLVTFCLCINFLIRDNFKAKDLSPVVAQTRKKRFLFVLYPLASFIAYTIFIVSIYSSDTNLILCIIAYENPVFSCEVPSLDHGAFVRYILIAVFGTVIYIIADIMLIHRAIVIWQGRKTIIFGLGLLLLADIAINVYLTVPSAFTPARNLACFAVSAAYDIIATSAIAGRLLWYRRQSSIIGPEEGRVYTSLLAVFFEASALTSTTRILAAGTIFSSSNASRWAIPLSTAGSAIAPMFIILRLALNAFNETYNSETHVTTISFAKGQRNAQISTFLGGAPDQEVSMGTLSTADSPQTRVFSRDEPPLTTEKTTV